MTVDDGQYDTLHLGLRIRIRINKNPGSGSVFCLKCWIRIRYTWILIRNLAYLLGGTWAERPGRWSWGEGGGEGGGGGGRGCPAPPPPPPPPCSWSGEPSTHPPRGEHAHTSAHHQVKKSHLSSRKYCIFLSLPTKTCPVLSHYKIKSLIKIDFCLKSDTKTLLVKLSQNLHKMFLHRKKLILFFLR